jgi:hypothetical protein
MARESGKPAVSGRPPAWSGIDANIPNVARVYDVLLGGRNNFGADRRAAAELLAAVPGAAVAARENRAFLARAVRYLCCRVGIRQFLDVGAGLPTGGSVHEIVEGAVPPARVVYADNDPEVVRQAEALAGGRLGVEAVHADLRQPRWLLAQPAVQRQINLAEPVAVLLVAVLHFLRNHDDPWAVVNYLKDQIAPGSYVVVSRVTADHIPVQAAVRARAAYEGASAPGVARSRDDIARFFGGLAMVRPGLVNVSDWRPDHLGPAATGPVLCYAGIGRKSSGGRPR